MTRDPGGSWLRVAGALGVPALLVLTALAAAGGGGRRGILEGFPGLEELRRWLSRAYVESQTSGGFGDYPLENLDVATLHQTHAALEIIGQVGPGAVQSPAATLSWVASLRKSGGMYDDPGTNAPILLETLWAVSVVRVLAGPALEVDQTAGALMAALEAALILESRSDGCATAHLSDAALAAAALERLLGSVFLQTAPQLATSREIAASLVGRLRSGPDGGTWRSLEGERDALLARVLACLLGSGTPRVASDILSQDLAALEGTQSDLPPESVVRALLDTCCLVWGWRDLPQRIQSSLQSYLAATLHRCGADGAYAWSNPWGVWVDPALNADRAALYAMAGDENPGTPALSRALDRLACHLGWSSLIQAIPGPDYTYFGVRLCSALGGCGGDETKLAAGARATLGDPASSAQDLLYGFRTLVALGLWEGADRAALVGRLEEWPPDDVHRDIYWLAPLHAEAAIAPARDARQALIATAFELTSGEGFPQMAQLRLLAYIVTLVGEDAGASEREIVRWVLALSTEDGGFRWSLGSSSPDLPSTYCAAELLALLGALGEARCDAMAAFVATCWREPGFLPLRPADIPRGEEFAIDLFTTYMGLQVLELLAAERPSA
ncbi:MAG: prenyltransferase/squalene oxidase repeat-containing protein [Candidatus Bipolaricaulota bacterium]